MTVRDRSSQETMPMPNSTPRRLIKTMLQRLAPRALVIYESIFRRLDELEKLSRESRYQLDAMAAQVETGTAMAQASLAMGWDHVALVRRLAVLEDRVADARSGVAAIDERVAASEAELAQASAAMGWDDLATARRLAILEERVEALMARQDAADKPLRVSYPSDPPADLAQAG